MVTMLIVSPRSLALKNPARRNLSLRVTCGVAPITGLRGAPSVTIQSGSLGMGSEMVRAVERAAWALRNGAQKSSVH